MLQSACSCGLAAVILLLSAGGLFAAPPRIFFSDLESGPNTGGQDNGGVFVTIHGVRFGATRGTSYVTIGGGRAAAYPIWTDSKVTFQLGSAATTGEVVINTPAGPSNVIPFTVRSGKIYFVAVTGSDGNNGSFAKPWRTLLKARDTIEPGDTIYAMDGVSQTVDDGQGWRAAMLIRKGGIAAAPNALVAYPGATVTIGNPAGPSYGIRTADSGICPGFWVFSGLVLRG
ncbi:MAG: IPT/TIG domain-containing protein, partial [Bryobacterales bacterium]|nr:IPT/TIG domain-containing protein [Bryobacterales bacterium]